MILWKPVKKIRHFTRARLKADRTLGNGETVQATLVVAGGDVAALKTNVQLDGVNIQNLVGDCYHFLRSRLRQEPGQVTASAENACDLFYKPTVKWFESSNL